MAAVLAMGTTAHANIGDLDWAIGFGSSGFDNPRAIATDPFGNVYVTGSFSGTVDFNPGPGVTELTSPAGENGSIFVAKYDADGGLVWARAMGGSLFSTGQDLAVDSQGNVFVTGWFNGTADLDPGPGEFIVSSPNFGELYVLKLDTNGIFQWAYALSNPTSCLGRRIALDSAGYVYVTGSFQGTIEFDPGPGSTELLGEGANDVFAVKLDTNGDLVWARKFGGPGDNQGYGIGVNSLGEVLVALQFTDTIDLNPGVSQFLQTSDGSSDIAVVKLTSIGNLTWGKPMGGTGENALRGLVVAPDDSLHITGYFNDTINLDPDITNFSLSSTIDRDVFVAKLDTNSNHEWAGALGVPFSAFGEGIAVDDDGNVYTTGSFVGTADFDPGTGSFDLISAGSNDAFISKLDANGNFVWAKSVGGTASDWGLGIAADALGAVHVIGRFAGTADMDPGAGTLNLTANGDSDVFVLKLKGEDQAVPVGLSGTITSADTGEPLACAAVEVYEIGIGEPIVAVTDANGFYFFEPLPAGSYNVRVLSPGFDTLTPAPLDLGAGEQRTENYALFERTAQPVVAGRVTDAETGEPLVWVFARLFVNGDFVDDSYTCASGFYEIPLPGGKEGGEVDIEVQFSLPNFQTETEEDTIDPAEGATVNSALQKSVIGLTFLTGKVAGRLGETSAPLENARITLRGPVSTSTETDADGLYVFDTLIDGSYTVTASADAFEGKSVVRNLQPVLGGEANFELKPVPKDVPGDVNGDGVVNAVDVQLVINAALGIDIDPDFEPDINGDGVVNAVDVQLVINAALGIDIAP